jgi:HlyD family secretion protein
MVMTRARPIAQQLAALVIALAALAACTPSQTPASHQGYVEAEFIHVAAPVAGRLDSLAVSRGQQVAADAPLFRLESKLEQAAVEETQLKLKAAEARIENLLGARRRPEIAALESQRTSAVAALTLSKSQLERAERLHVSGFASKARLDEARATVERDRSRLNETEAQIASATQSIGRAAEVRAAQADAEAARAVLAQARWRLDNRQASAPLAAFVHETYFAEHEWVPANAPIVSLLSPANIKLRFFVPEALAGGVRVGQRVEARCTGCASLIPAAVTYISPRPEYTPPVIYSREARAKLVFLVEARPEQGLSSIPHPGQPIDVTLLPDSKQE